MSIPGTRPSALVRAIDDAHALVDMGVPVFTGRLDANGDPDGRDKRWKSWQEYEPDHDIVEAYRKGEAICAVTGVIFDVLDYDPRNGGRLSMQRLNKDLGDEGPVKYWEVATPSGGAHLYIAPMGIGSRTGFLPGLDLKGGKPDGTSRGFVFLPPTVRPSKDPSRHGQLLQYRARIPLSKPVGDGSNQALIRYIETDLQVHEFGAEGVRPARLAREALRGECLLAGPGDQRPALLRYVHELERCGYAPDDIVELLKILVAAMPVYDESRPWYPAKGKHPEAYLRGLLHKEGVVIGDASADELAGMMTPRVAGTGLTPFSSVESKITRWLWSRYIAIGDITILDADPGKGKSLLSIDIAAKHTRGIPMPLETKASVPPGNVLILAPEDRAEVIKARLQAAGADLSRVYRPAIEGRGKPGSKKAYFNDEMLTFPDKIGRFATWIKDYDITLVIIDPIAAFLSERINSHNDASVRRALEPLAVVLGEQEAGAFLIRHLNKDANQKAHYRGGGSTAFSAVSRVSLIAADLPPSVGVHATYGIATLKNSHLEKRPDEVLTYRVRDSGIVADSEGNFVPCIEWHGTVDISIDYLMSGKEHGSRRGPEPVIQEEIADILEAMFAMKDTWTTKEAYDELKQSGVSINRNTVDKVRKKLGIRAVQEFNPAGGVAGWVWTTEKESVRSPRRAKREEE